MSVERPARKTLDTARQFLHDLFIHLFANNSFIYSSDVLKADFGKNYAYCTVAFGVDSLPPGRAEHGYARVSQQGGYYVATSARPWSDRADYPDRYHHLCAAGPGSWVDVDEHAKGGLCDTRPLLL